MKAYIQISNNNQCSNPNSFAAYEGFLKLGWEIVFYKDVALITGNNPEDVVVGGINDVHKILHHFHFDIPTPLDYPESIRSFLGRKIWKSTMHQFANNNSFNIFIKPLHRSKSFTGKLITCERDLIGCYDFQSDTDIWCSESVNFIAEWRCFVRHGKILDVRRYRGNWKLQYNPEVIENAVHSYTNSPKAYAMDFGVTDNGRTLLIEANDGYSLGSYGLPVLDYAKLLSTRWAELTSSKDYGDF
ncbi:DUF4343 domain-containing protein [Chitinophaga silvatica]|uniref:DUF4343 domain-containing protein n=1 Tax=Chitinophaga silvatica TaxID=2282649 RepID=A0A3E1Y442_9BACT|nr:ATP-grasp domain-containing protein [Chitinophaga silvatica]RFS19448.1 DUF4343 domain-containing protein [Chitinophaga silvatica]